MIAQIPAAELPIPIERQTNKKNAEIEKQSVITEAKMGKCST